MIATLIGIIAYVLLSCLANKKNVIAYVTDNKYTLLVTACICIILSFFGKAALTAVVMAFVTPYLVAYGIPSLLGKLGDIWNRLMENFKKVVD